MSMNRPAFRPAMRHGLSNSWQDWVTLILGVWLIASPWLLSFSTMHVPSYNAWIVGIVLAVLSIAALARVQPWEEWINMLLGIWLLISPWVLGFSTNSTVTWNAVIVGILAFVAAVWELNEIRQDHLTTQ